MEKITATELLSQLTDALRLLSASSDEQEDWLEENRYPIVELASQVLDAIPGWFPRLRSAGLLEPSAEASLQHLADNLRSLEAAPIWSEMALKESIEWQHIRGLATEALGALTASP